MHWFRVLQIVLEVMVALLAVPLLKAIMTRGTVQLRSFTIYYPIIFWAVAAGLAITTVGALTRNVTPGLAAQAVTALLVVMLGIEITTLVKYYRLPRHNNKTLYELYAADRRKMRAEEKAKAA